MATLEIPANNPMYTPEIQAKRMIYFNRLTEYTEAQRSGADATASKAASHAAGYDYLQALIAHHAAPSNELGEPMIIDYEIGSLKLNSEPMILSFFAGDSLNDIPRAPTEHSEYDSNYQATIAIAPTCYLDEWTPECERIYNQQMNGGTGPL